jgi:hypothetical protein
MKMNLNRRRVLAAIPAALAATSVPHLAAQSKLPMQLHVDLIVEPAQAAGLKETFDKVFRPVIRKQPGFVDVRLLKYSLSKMGQPPARCTYRLLISFETEKQREAWVASADHQKVWPQMEKHIKLATALVFDVVV